MGRKAIKRLSILALALSLTTLSACGSSSSGGISSASPSAGSPADLGYTCTFTEVDLLSVGTDPTQNFSVMNALYSSSIENNNCTEITFSTKSPTVIPSVTRSGGLITLESSGNSDSITITGDQATIPQSDLAICSNSIQMTGTLSEVELNPNTGTITVYLNWSAVVNDCTQTPTSQGQSAPAPLVTDNTSPSPSPSPSSNPQIGELGNEAAPASWTHFVIDSQNNIYLPDLNEHGVIETGPTATLTRFFPANSASVVAKDSSDNIYVFTGQSAGGMSAGSPPPSASMSIQMISSAGVTSLISNSLACQIAAFAGFGNGGVVDSKGNLYFSSGTNITQVTPSGLCSTFASGFQSAVAGAMNSLAIDGSDQIYILSGGQTIMKITPAGVVSTVHTFQNNDITSMIRDSSGNFFYMEPFSGNNGYFLGELTSAGAEVPYCGSSSPASKSVLTGDCSSTYIYEPSGFGMDFDPSGNIVFNQNTDGTVLYQPSALYRVSP